MRTMGKAMNDALNDGRDPFPYWKVWLSDDIDLWAKSPPCTFHRWMQRIFFGFIWERVP